jgi:hypothetical protein
MSEQRNFVLQVVVAAAGVALLLLIVTLLLGFHERGVITDRICHAQVTDRKALRRSFVVARDFSLTSPVRSAYERERIASFYTRILSQTPALKCAGGKPVPTEEGTS